MPGFLVGNGAVSLHMLEHAFGSPFLLLDDGESVIGNENFHFVAWIDTQRLALGGREGNLPLRADDWHVTLTLQILDL